MFANSGRECRIHVVYNMSLLGEKFFIGSAEGSPVVNKLPTNSFCHQKSICTPYMCVIIERNIVQILGRLGQGQVVKVFTSFFI